MGIRVTTLLLYNIALPLKIISYSDSNQMIGQGLFDMVKTVFCPQDRDALLNVNAMVFLIVKLRQRENLKLKSY